MTAKIYAFSPRLCRGWLDAMVEKWASFRTAGQRRAYLRMRAKTYETRLLRAGLSDDEVAEAMQELRDGVRRAMQKRRDHQVQAYQREKVAAAKTIHHDFGHATRVAARRRATRTASIEGDAYHPLHLDLECERADGSQDAAHDA